MGEVRYLGKTYKNVMNVSAMERSLMLQYPSCLVEHITWDLDEKDRVQFKTDKGCTVKVKSLETRLYCYIEGKIKRLLVKGSCSLLGTVEDVNSKAVEIRSREFIKSLFKYMEGEYLESVVGERRRKVVRLSGNFDMITTNLGGVAEEVILTGDFDIVKVGTDCYVKGEVDKMGVNKLYSTLGKA